MTIRRATNVAAKPQRRPRDPIQKWIDSLRRQIARSHDKERVEVAERSIASLTRLEKRTNEGTHSDQSDE